MDQLATMLALSRRNLERRFKKATSNTVVEYIQRVRVEAAKQNLESSRDNVNEVMYKVGYTDSESIQVYVQTHYRPVSCAIQAEVQQDDAV